MELVRDIKSDLQTLLNDISEYKALAVNQKALDTFVVAVVIQQFSKQLKELELLYNMVLVELEQMKLYPPKNIKNTYRTKNELMQTLNFIQKTKVDLLNLLTKLKASSQEEVPNLSININFKRATDDIPEVVLDE